MDSLGLIQKISIFILPVLFAITVHEASHAYAARYFGDNTAYHEGRMTLNPLKHIDPVGTVLLPLLCVALGGFIFGWAKPVPVNFGRLRQPKKDMLWVAAAGPLSNLAMAAGWMVLLRVALGTDTGFSTPLMLMSQAGVTINVMLMVLNLLPLPPLDGGRIAVSLLPPQQAWQFSRLEPYGMWILIGLMATGLLSVIMRPLMDIVFRLLNALI